MTKWLEITVIELWLGKSDFKSCIFSGIRKMGWDRSNLTFPKSDLDVAGPAGGAQVTTPAVQGCESPETGASITTECIVRPT